MEIWSAAVSYIESTQLCNQRLAVLKKLEGRFRSKSFVLQQKSGKDFSNVPEAVRTTQMLHRKRRFDNVG
ncbi:uncharacterized [Tachysurus ichikawai]